jgi:hypothetical protein
MKFTTNPVVIGDMGVGINALIKALSSLAMAFWVDCFGFLLQIR